MNEALRDWNREEHWASNKPSIYVRFQTVFSMEDSGPDIIVMYS